MKTNKRAISLIVLVITIIVMIILATAIIITLSNSGIIDKANEAVDKTNDAQVQQIAQLGWAEAYAEFGADLVKLDEGVVNALEANGIDPNDYERNVTKTGVTLTKKEKAPVTLVPEEWKPNVSAIIDGVPIPAGFVASSVVGETEKAAGLVIYEGEEAVTASNHYDALRTRNQYVWVPVPDFSKFVRRTFGENVTLVNTIGGKSGTHRTTNDSDYWEVVLDENNMPTDTRTGVMIYEYYEYNTSISEEELATIKAMYASVKKYGGFYTARYETGKDNVSVMNAVPSLGNNVRSYSSRDSVTETMIYGVQWDTTIQWILDSGSTFTGYSLTQAISLEDLNEGAKYGKYRADKPEWFNWCDDNYWGGGCATNRRVTEFQSITSGKEKGTEWYLTTGALKSAKQNNIYDMLGNYVEMTGEKFSAEIDFGRGGTLAYSVRDGVSREADVWKWYCIKDDEGFNLFFETATRSALYINN